MKYCLVLSLALYLLLTAGCKEYPEAPSSPNGGVFGCVKLYDSDGNPVKIVGGVSVAVNGSNRLTQTNDSGKWMITGLSAGTYTFSFSKPGFGATKIIGYKFAGSGTTPVDTVSMAEPSHGIINFQRFTIVLSSDDSTASYDIIGAMPQPYLDTRYLVLCFGGDSTALAHDPESAPVLLPFLTKGSGYDGGFLWKSTNTFSLRGNTITHGEKLYACLCIVGKGSGSNKFSNYYDPSIGKVVYTSFGQHSQILSAVMP